MTEVGASTSGTTNPMPVLAIAAVLGSMWVLVCDPSTAPKFYKSSSQEETANSSRPIATIPNLQVVDTQAPATTPPKLIDYHVSLEQLAVAKIAADQIIIDTMNEVETDESLDRFQQYAHELIDLYGPAGIGAFDRLLLRATNPPSEELARRFILSLGERRAEAAHHVAYTLLLQQLDSPLAGRRSAAAESLSAFPESPTLAALERRKKVENNRFVLATLGAQVRTLKANGVSPS